MSKEIAIVGIGETPPARRSDKDVRELVLDAVFEAVADAGIEPHEVDGIVTDGAVMPPSVPHEYVAAQLGATRSFDASMSYAGAGTVGAAQLAQLAIQSGLAKVVVCYFGVDWATRPEGPYGFHDAYPAKFEFEKPYGFNGQPSYFALWARRYMHEYGLTEEDFGRLAVQQRENALRTGRAQMTKPMTLDDYMSSPMITDPLRRPDCCLISDGAGAFVMTSAARARDCAKKPVYVQGVGFASAPMTADDVFTQGPDLLTLPGVGAAREQVERQSGVSLADADFAELYDCFTISCLLQIEDLGLCKKGEAGAFVAEGHTRLDGHLPVNTHGGLLSYSYRLAIEHVVEAVRQLRGEAGDVQVPGAQMGFVTGLSMPDYGIMMLSR